MGERIQNLFLGIADRFIAYMPNLLAGILLVLLGWLLGWFVKRLIIQLSVVLRLERFLVRLSWGEDFSKADVRYGFYGFIGNAAFLIVLLIFIDNALIAWKLKILSDLLSNAILFLPRTFIAATMLGIGWLLASWSQKAVLSSLRREEVPRASLISRFVKAVLFLLFSAMALAELNVAREIVVIGFATIYITLGALTVVFAVFEGRGFLRKMR